MANRLARESSPYLLQHADNPVDWRPWGEEALAEARASDRPLLVSIGYSACHWCHVMERESFADPATAELMNRWFVSVKVDREERPDVDAVYMRAVQAMTGQGGWPLTAFLTPEGVPFYGGTYFPPVRRQGMPSFREVLTAVAVAWRDRRDQVTASAGRIREALERSLAPTGAGAVEGAAGAALAQGAFRAAGRPLRRGTGRLRRRPQVPPARGAGLPPAPPPPHRRGLRRAPWPLHTLRRMAAGGMRDHLGGGFHRYSVDARWLVPHFEKMLYDQALLARVYLHAWQATGDEALRSVAEETLDYVLADLRDPAGGFYAARDADSEGEEGRFYLWTPAQVEAVLDPDDARLVERAYDVTAGGNFEGRSILHRSARARPPSPGPRGDGLPKPWRRASRRRGAGSWRPAPGGSLPSGTRR